MSLAPFSIRLLAMSVAALVALAACSNAAESEPTTTSTTEAVEAGPGVEFGSGTVPATVPAAFPIPAEAVVGTTLVDSNRGITEMLLTFPASVPDVAAYYAQNLEGNGFSVETSEGSEQRWTLTFSGHGVDGTVRVVPGSPGVSAAAVQLLDT